MTVDNQKQGITHKLQTINRFTPPNVVVLIKNPSQWKLYEQNYFFKVYAVYKIIRDSHIFEREVIIERCLIDIN